LAKNDTILPSWNILENRALAGEDKNEAIDKVFKKRLSSEKFY
jgi:hypothetical protein